VEVEDYVAHNGTESYSVANIMLSCVKQLCPHCMMILKQNINLVI